MKNGTSSPTNLTISTTGDKDSGALLRWDHSNYKDDYQEFEKFYIYKDGVLTGETVNKEFSATSVESDKVYSYAITAIYQERDTNIRTETPRSDCIANYSSFYSLPYVENFENGSFPRNMKSEQLNSLAGYWHVENEAAAAFPAQDGDFMLNYSGNNGAVLDTVRLETPYINESGLKRCHCE